MLILSGPTAYDDSLSEPILPYRMHSEWLLYYASSALAVDKGRFHVKEKETTGLPDSDSLSNRAFYSESPTASCKQNSLSLALAAIHSADAQARC